MNAEARQNLEKVREMIEQGTKAGHITLEAASHMMMQVGSLAAETERNELLRDQNDILKNIATALNAGTGVQTVIAGTLGLIEKDLDSLYCSKTKL
jgi:hypothetical protein